jgi:hypothetical protein
MSFDPNSLSSLLDIRKVRRRMGRIGRFIIFKKSTAKFETLGWQRYHQQGC